MASSPGAYGHIAIYHSPAYVFISSLPLQPVIPAQAGIYACRLHYSSRKLRRWIPAKAGMTVNMTTRPGSPAPLQRRLATRINHIENTRIAPPRPARFAPFPTLPYAGAGLRSPAAITRPIRPRPVPNPKIPPNPRQNDDTGPLPLAKPLRHTQSMSGGKEIRFCQSQEEGNGHRQYQIAPAHADCCRFCSTARSAKPRGTPLPWASASKPPLTIPG